MNPSGASSSSLELFHPAVREWFRATFRTTTRVQELGWPAVARGESVLVFSPTGSGKTLSAFLWAIDRLMFAPTPARAERCRVVYISPLKALAVDVERNLRAPLEGIARMAAARGVEFVPPAIQVRTGDTPASERARFRREPADILITTPESLYLILTSNAREALRSTETIIVDEIHALVPTKRGAHLALSLERLDALCRRRPQRLGLSATQRPLDEVARFLGGADPSAGRVEPRRSEAGASGSGGADIVTIDEIRHQVHDEFTTDRDTPRYRPITIVDAHEPKRLRLRVEVPVEDMAKLPPPAEAPEIRRATGDRSIWASIQPRLLELIRQHRSTLLFVNNRRLAERLAGALNDLAGGTIARAHHGSIARAQRLEIEEDLKAGRIAALVATSSLELGIDMGAIDLVVQVEAPPSVASGLQRIGRSRHQVGATSEGIIVPKFRGDLLACAAATQAMHAGAVEAARFPRNPLDVLAQQMVAMVAMDPWSVEALYAIVRSAAPFAGLRRRTFEGVLDMLSGRYPADEFAELRPRLTWDRTAGMLTAREGARTVAVTSGGTIPDRGLYGVFLAGAERGFARVGELDEEMVFESRVGETFLLGASTWRIAEITHDRVVVTPAPGEPGKMPFWRGDQAGRPLEFGRAIGRLVREVRELPGAAAIARLVRDHDLDERAAENLLRYLQDQLAATGAVADDRTVIVERCRDELGDWRVCVLSPLGGKVHAPWAMAVVAGLRDRGLDVETMWADDGFVVRFAGSENPPDVSWMIPAAADVETLVMQQLGSTALFAGKFREAAARALLLPRRRPGTRAPLWQQRKRAADLLAIAARYGSFPVVLETYRECLRDVFDLPALVETLEQIAVRDIEVVAIDSERPSPFAASLLFGYVANYIYDGDAPLAERRAQALSVDQAQLRELIGDAELRELLDADALEEIEQQLQHLDERRRAKHADALHDLLLDIGDLSESEIARRSATLAVARSVRDLVHAGRALALIVAGEPRYIAIEDAGRYRDAVGTPLPAGIPPALLEPVRDPLGDLVQRYARTHGPFRTEDCAARLGLRRSVVQAALERRAAIGRVMEGEFRPGGASREWCDSDVLRSVRRRSLARLRHEVEPVEPPALGRFLASWHGLSGKRRGADALLDAIEQLQGARLPASLLETEILPARIEAYDPADLDLLAASGEVVWLGAERLGERDGRIALYLSDSLPRLVRPPALDDVPDRERLIVEHLRERGASFFAAMHAAAGGGYPGETVAAIWNLVWRGAVTNDTFHALRTFTRPPPRRARKPADAAPFRSRRLTPPATEGRWSLIENRVGCGVSPTEHITALARQLLARYGILTREAAGAEAVSGGFGAVYPILKAMEESGRIRRGYFVAGLGGAQFALPAAVELLRRFREPAEEPQVVVLAATDPANPYGAILEWPQAPPRAPHGDEPRSPTRSVGASVILVDGGLAAYLGKGDRQLFVYLPDHEPARSTVASQVATTLVELARGVGLGKRGLLISDINGASVASHPLAGHLVQAGFVPTAMGFQARRK